VVVLVTPAYLAEIVTVRSDDTDLVLTVNVALVAPAGTVTVGGTVATVVSLLARDTTAPPAGAVAVSRTVPVTDFPPLTDELRNDTDDKAASPPPPPEVGSTAINGCAGVRGAGYPQPAITEPSAETPAATASVQSCTAVTPASSSSCRRSRMPVAAVQRNTRSDDEPLLINDLPTITEPSAEAACAVLVGPPRVPMSRMPSAEVHRKTRQKPDWSRAPRRK
jgi:hypothetical protein